MKKNLLYAGILLVLIAISGFLIWQERTKDQTPWQKKFAFEDTASVHKIYMADKSNEDVTLERKDGRWIVNGRFRAMPNKVNMLLTSLHDMEVKFPVSTVKKENVVKELAGSATKVEIYAYDNDEEPVRTFYVGGPTQGKKGTYMVRSRNGEIAEQPYVTHIPGFQGYLTPRFFIAEKEWRDLQMVTYNYEQIKSVEVKYPQAKQHSFEVTKLANDSVTVRKLYGRSSANNEQLMPTAARKFLNSFQDLRAEAIETKYDKQDSILATTPYAVIHVTPQEGEVQTLTIYHKPVTPTTKKQFTAGGERLQYDQDRYFATLARDDDFYMIQHYVFGKVLRRYSDFFARQQPT